MINRLAPVVLFVYNRPKHTLKTLRALQKNKGSAETDLYIFCDGAKPNANSSNLQKIQEVRQLVRSEKWCKTVTIREAKSNQGLADSIVKGVTEIINKYQKIIVLEDDIETSPLFLKFMNEALDFYENEEKVMHLSGYMFPVKVPLPPTFFFNTTSCWGWATWKRAWDYFNPDAEFLLHELQTRNLTHQFSVESSSSHLQQLEANVNGTLKTWAVKWYASVFLQNGFCLHPYPSLTQNIGQDSTGVHSGSTNYYTVPELAETITLEKIPLKESEKARKAMQYFWKNEPKAPLIYRIQSKFRKLQRLFD